MEIEDDLDSFEFLERITKEDLENTKGIPCH
jgi:hypothetical protein